MPVPLYATGAAITMRFDGWAEPEAGSIETATVPTVAGSTGPGEMCIAVPSAVDWNKPAGRGAWPLGMVHISYVCPGGSGGRFEAIRSTPSLGFTRTLPRGGAGWPRPKFTCWVSG